ncbi:winged helix-turn-helix transcriptional regulator [Siphonobacter aquaeclarae]|uniref:Transcriptional regulator, HxlR family n=1 Tax=Siphonobacter aquaeclarae TaxID=563176 RepID=A0A1G9M6M9_9BACT|nr:helix-turn-helix domain-containing protein [Siphonobacter aquaeclarae]SDL69952.1 transcriptional regulator, HxlR family [Siphonobacter aquaeclarae]
MEVTNVDNQLTPVQKKIEKIFSLEDGIGICPVRGILDRIGDKWSFLTIMQLGGAGTLRFSELRARIGDISQRMLTVTLRSLEEDGLIRRVYYPEVPPRVEYSLTPLGESLLERMLDLAEWANSYKREIVRARQQYIAG